MSLSLEIVVVGRNLDEFAARCVESVCWQQGSVSSRFRWYDDASDWPSRRRIRSLVERAGGEFMCGPRRLFQVGALDAAIRGRGDPTDVVCLLDADDYLMPDALSVISSVYDDPDIAMTWGSCLIDCDPFRDAPYFAMGVAGSNSEYPEDVWVERSFRSDVFRCFHLRTFKRWLWQLIDPMDLRRPDGSPIRGSGDAAFLYPMLEMLGNPRHARLVREKVYVYRLHAGNVWRIDKASQAADFDMLRSRQLYPRLPRARLRGLLRG